MFTLYFMEIIFTIFYSAVFIYLIYRLKFFRIPGITWKILSVLFLVKVICGVILSFIYTYYYTDRTTADIFKYFDGSKPIFDALFVNPLDYLRMVTGIGADAEHLMKYYEESSYWFKQFNYGLYNDNRTMLRFNAVIRLFSFGYFNVHTVFMSFISFTGLTALFKLFYYFLPDRKVLLLAGVFLVPSTLLWTSGVLKEGILLFALGFLVYSSFRLMTGSFKISHLVMIIISIALLLLNKFYILAAILPGLISFLWIVLTKYRKPLLKFIIVHVIFFIVALNSSYFTGGYDFLLIMSRKQADFITMAKAAGDVGSLISIPVLQPAFASFAVNAPGAFLNTLLRPHLFEIHSFFSLIAAVENFILALIILTFIFFSRKKLSDGIKPLLLLSVFFVFILFVLSGLITPVLGALVRYRTPALPFLFFILIGMTDMEKWKKVLKKSFCFFITFANKK